MRFPFRLHSLILIILFGCIEKDINQTATLFQLLSPERTNIHFVNRIQENDSLNLLSYEYMYNGGGVGILDVNNDGLNDILFTGNQVPNALYLNKGNLHFEDISSTAGISLDNEWSTGVSVVDINCDGFDDLYICVGGPGNKDIFPNKLFVNQQDNTFSEMSDAYGIADPGESNQAVFFDYDKDGDLDMYLMTGGGLERSAIILRPILTGGESRNTDRLYQNNFDTESGHPVFKNVSSEAGITIEGFGLGVAVIDANQDSWPDVYISNDYLSRDLLYINNQDGTFTDKSLDFFKHTSHFSMGNDVGDINNDGLMDIFTLDMLPADHQRRKLMFDPNRYDRFQQTVKLDYGYQYMRNMLHLNNGQGFSEIGQLAGVYQTDWSWAPLLADFDNDGFLDIYITNGFGKDITDLDFVHYRREAFSPFSKRTGMAEYFLDSLEQRPAISPSNFIFKNQGDLSFSDQSANWGIYRSSISNGAAYADLDGDGDLEIIVNNINEPAFIFNNLSIEKDSLHNNFLKIHLAGPDSNPSAFGSSVTLFLQGKFQTRYQQVARGFQGSVDKNLHFGLGKHHMIDSIQVVWPNGKQSTFIDISANKLIQLSFDESSLSSPAKEKPLQYFSEEKLMQYIHVESDFNDFRNQPTLISGFSRQGPGIAVGDVNNDGLDDLFVGGAYSADGAIFIQMPDQQFSKLTLDSKNFEDLGAIFFDADGDNDLDLYVTSGGSERYATHKNYQDRLYFNDGSGHFSYQKSALPSMISSSSIVTAGDYDLDGDLDLFVGGRVVPGKFPTTPESYILENRGGQFWDITDLLCPEVRNIGMVTSAIWTDYNNDTWPDLIVVGEFMPISLFKNTQDELVNISGQSSLEKSHGLWNSIYPFDIDNDGDMDYVAGNIGLNTPFQVNEFHPLEVHYGDFDRNGSIDPVFTVFEGDVSFPLNSLDQLGVQFPMLKKQIPTYRDYAATTTNKLLNIAGDATPKTLKCTIATSSLISNLGNDQFSITPLETMTQIAPVNGIIAEDINLDGLVDLILTGNSYDCEVVHGRYDASVGNVLMNLGNDTFDVVPPMNTNFHLDGNAKALVRLEMSGEKSILLASQSDDKLKIYSIHSFDNLPRVSLYVDEVSAILTFSGGHQRKLEFPVGGGYLSQSSKSIVLTPQVTEIEIFNIRGETSRKMEVKGSQDL